MKRRISIYFNNLFSLFKIKRNDKGYSLETSLFLTMIIAIITYFVAIFRHTDSLYIISGWILWVFIVIIYFLILYTGDIAKYRRIFFITHAMLFFPSFIAVLIDERGTMSFSAETVFKTENPFCHRVIPLAIIPHLVTGEWIFPGRLFGLDDSIYTMLILWILATLTIGKGWCSWVCFYGGWDDGFSHIAKKPRINIDHRNNKFRYFSFAMMLFLVLASLSAMASVLCIWLCPFKIITEYAEITNATTFIMFIIMVVAFFGLAIILPFFTKKRIQCTTLCPFFAFQSLLDKVSPYRVRVDKDKCVKCLKCVKECPTLSMDQDDINNETGKTVITCTKCSKCIDLCKENAIHYTCMGFKHTKIFNEEENCNVAKDKYIYKFKAIANEVLSPRALFIFNAITLGMVVMSKFVVETIARCLNLIINGSFFF